MRLCPLLYLPALASLTMPRKMGYSFCASLALRKSADYALQRLRIAGVELARSASEAVMERHG